MVADVSVVETGSKVWFELPSSACDLEFYRRCAFTVAEGSPDDGRGDIWCW
jgi:hypothetical protein